jgi:ABC-type transport system involved in cytochrome bd biosynthesis fused ATPase/permease subunit
LLLRAAELSAIDQDLGSFSDGWETLIGERGLTLSGGQKQRVAISRAVIGSPEILILDDSLSAVDAETEKRVLTRLLNERRERKARGGSSTIIIISHRVSTLQNADQVIVLDKGRISESGSPSDLIERGGFYAQMAALQRLEQNEAKPAAGDGGVSETAPGATLDAGAGTAGMVPGTISDVGAGAGRAVSGTKPASGAPGGSHV